MQLLIANEPKAQISGNANADGHRPKSGLKSGNANADAVLAEKMSKIWQCKC